MKIKICGITQYKDAKFAIDCGADVLGFIFYQKSPRYIAPDKAKEIVCKLPDTTKTVGVFVNETNETMQKIVELVGLKILQLHGNESIEQLEQIRNVDIVKAVTLSDRSDLTVAQVYKDYLLLVDSLSRNYGGSGICSNWELAAELSKSHQIYLAGGLTPGNVSDAIRVVQPFGVDVSSGVESTPGVKSFDKIKRFIDNARNSFDQ